MIDIYRNPLTHNYDISLSVDEWKEILCLPEIRKDPNILSALEKWYLAPNHMTSCKSLEERYGQDSNFFSVQNRRLGQFAARHLKRFRLVGENGKETYWGIAWIELKKERGIYTNKLRPELVDAIRALGLFAQDTDSSLNHYLQQQDLRQEEPYEFTHEKYEKVPLSEQRIKLYPRDPVAAKKALLHANFKCEFNALHDTFPRESDGLPYMETHHLIPLKYADDFSLSIDVPENIISLCSTCHNRIHYGRNKNEIIEYLWHLRKSDLSEAGICIGLSELLNLYLM